MKVQKTPQSFKLSYHYTKPKWDAVSYPSTNTIKNNQLVYRTQSIVYLAIDIRLVLLTRWNLHFNRFLDTHFCWRDVVFTNTLRNVLAKNNIHFINIAGVFICKTSVVDNKGFWGVNLLKINWKNEKHVWRHSLSACLNSIKPAMHTPIHPLTLVS